MDKINQKFSKSSKNPRLGIFELTILSTIVLVIFGTGITHASGTNQVTVDGYFNIGEKVYQNGSSSYEYYLFSNNQTNTPTYFLKFTNMPPSNIFEISGKNVHVTGHNDFIQSQNTKFVQSAIEMYADSITPKQDSKVVASTSSNLVTSSSITGTLSSVTILLQFQESSTVKPHPLTYFQSRFYTDPDSFSAYWKHTSYNQMSISGQVVDWQLLPKLRPQYISGTGNFLDQVAASDGISLADPTINFNGVQQVIFIFNNSFPSATNAAYSFGYLSPVQINTAEGIKMVFESFLPDLGAGFAVDRSYYNGIGVVAHETGHNFGWIHTSAPPPAFTQYDDTWSLMSHGGNRIITNSGTATGPLSAISYNRDLAGWIPSANKITIPQGQQSIFTLDVLDVALPSSNYLMGKVPFGSAGNYLILEARKNGTFDFTPQGQMGLVIYNFSATGHPESPEPYDLVNIVDISGVGNFDGDDLQAGQTFTWTKNSITIKDISHTANTITLSVSNNINCILPSTGDWIVTSSCTLLSSFTAPANVIVQNGAVLTIPAGTSLNINFINNHLLVKSGGGVLIKSGASIK